MDILRGWVFADDRQVHYLEAYRYKNDGEESKLYIDIERLTTYKQKLHYYFEFKDQFDVDSPYDGNLEIQEDLLAVLNKEQRQRLVLELNRIEAFDQQGDSQ